MSFQVFIADDHPAVVAGIRCILEKRCGASVVGEANSPGELLEKLGRTPCNLLILDYTMPPKEGEQTTDGLQLLRELQRRHPDLPIVLFTMMSNPTLLQGTLELGVRAIISKGDPVDELPSVCTMVLSGHVLVGQRLRNQLASQGFLMHQRGATPKSGAITSREAEVLRLLLRGSNVNHIARMLHRSPKTISNQKCSAMVKLGARNDAELFEFARERNID